MIGIVTVLYNSANVLEEFFATLNLQTIKDFVLIAVDNNSRDNSIEIFKDLANKAEFKTILLEEKENWGIAKGNNIGITKALELDCNYVLLSNNDIVLRVDTIERLFCALNDPTISIVVPKIHYYDTNRRLWFGGGRFSMLSGPRHDYLREEDNSQADKEKIIDYSPTCFMLLKSEVFKTVGMMDENYFVYWDDTDFVWRACHKYGLKMLYVPSSLLEHRVGFSSGGDESVFTIKYDNRNKIYFAYKNLSFIRRNVFFIYTLLRYYLKIRKNFDSYKKKLVVQSWKEGYILYKRMK